MSAPTTAAPTTEGTGVAPRTASPTPAPRLDGLLVADDGAGTVTVRIDGSRLAQGLAGLRWHLTPILPGGTDVLRIDLQDVDRLSSVCVAALLRVKRACVARRIQVVLDRPTSRSRDLLKRTGLGDVLETVRR